MTHYIVHLEFEQNDETKRTGNCVLIVGKNGQTIRRVDFEPRPDGFDIDPFQQVRIHAALSNAVAQAELIINSEAAGLSSDTKEPDPAKAWAVAERQLIKHSKFFALAKEFFDRWYTDDGSSHTPPDLLALGGQMAKAIVDIEEA